jgi:AcrR family transcriptional regulator
MAPKPKPSKREAILDAMLDLVVERGFHDAPMSVLAKRSGASAGVIYHYFASKDEIIQALYDRIRTLKVEAFLGDFSLDQAPRDTFIRACMNFYTFYRKHQREMRFYEQYEKAGFACSPGIPQDDKRAAAFARRFSSQSRGGVLKEWPADVLEEMTIGLVIRLAGQRRKLSEPLVREIAESMWEMVKAED